MNKKEAVILTLEYIATLPDAFTTRIVTSCGHISRLAWDWNEHSDYKLKIIPFTGAMGTVIPFSIGLSIADQTRPVYAIMGDGEFLMGFNALNNMRHQEEYLGKLTHIVLNDQKYSSTGGQPTAFHEFMGGACWDLHDWVSDKFEEFVDRMDKESCYVAEKLSLVIQDVHGEYETPPRIPDEKLLGSVR